MTDVVSVFLVKGIVGNKSEGVTPENEAVVHGETKSFEEKRILESAKVLQVAVLPEVEVQIAHTEGEVMRECIDRGSVDRSAGKDGIRVREVGVGSGEVFGEVQQDRSEAIVFIEARERTSGELWAR